MTLFFIVTTQSTSIFLALAIVCFMAVVMKNRRRHWFLVSSKGLKFNRAISGSGEIDLSNNEDGLRKRLPNRTVQWDKSTMYVL